MTQRVGLIIPSSNRMVEDEMVHAYPEGVHAHITRLRMTAEHKVPLDQLSARITEAAGALADARCEAITFHCTANSTDGGTEGEALILEALNKAGAAKVSTTATALRRAFAALKAKRVVMVTPYSQKVTDHEAEFLAAVGAQVLTAVGHGLDGSDAYCAAPPSFWRDKTLEVRHKDADLYFISCANTASMSVVDELERRLERPVITSNQIVVWDQVRALGIEGAGRAPGRLFKH